MSLAFEGDDESKPKLRGASVSQIRNASSADGVSKRGLEWNKGFIWLTHLRSLRQFQS